MDNELKEAVLLILRILSTAESVKEFIDDSGYYIQAQYVIEEHEKTACKKMLKSLGG